MLHLTIALLTGCNDGTTEPTTDVSDPELAWELAVKTTGPVVGPVVHAGGVWVYADGALHRLDEPDTLVVGDGTIDEPSLLMAAGPERLLLVAQGVTSMVDTSQDPAVVLWDTADQSWGLPSAVVGDRILYTGGAYLDPETGELTPAEREFYHCYPGPYGACCPLHGDWREALVVTPEGAEVRSVTSYTTIDLACWLHEDGSLTVLGVEEKGNLGSPIVVSREGPKGTVQWASRLGGRTGWDNHSDPRHVSGHGDTMFVALDGDAPISLESTPAGLEQYANVFREYVGDGFRIDFNGVGGGLEFVSPGGESTMVPMKGDGRPTIVVHDRRAYATFGTLTSSGGRPGNLLIWLFSLGSAGAGEPAQLDTRYEVVRSRFRFPASR